MFSFVSLLTIFVNSNIFNLYAVKCKIFIYGLLILCSFYVLSRNGCPLFAQGQGWVWTGSGPHPPQINALSLRERASLLHWQAELEQEGLQWGALWSLGNVLGPSGKDGQSCRQFLICCLHLAFWEKTRVHMPPAQVESCFCTVLL